MSVWNRRVTATADGQNLQVDEVTQNPNPPGRSDSANYITVKASDRPAQINYLADGVALTGIQMKDDQPIPQGLQVNPNGNNLRITDDGSSGTDYSYYLVGDYGSNNGIKTQDPQIHNIQG